MANGADNTTKYSFSSKNSKYKENQNSDSFIGAGDGDQALVRDAVALISTGVSEIGIRSILKRYPKVSSDGRLVEDKFNAFLQVATREYGDLVRRIDALAERNAILILVDSANFLLALHEELEILRFQRNTFRELLADQKLFGNLIVRYQIVGQEIHDQTFGRLSKTAKLYCRTKFKTFRFLESKLLLASKFSRSLALTSPKNVNIANLINRRTAIKLLHTTGALFLRAVRPVVKLAEQIGRFEMRFFKGLGRLLNNSAKEVSKKTL